MNVGSTLLSVAVIATLANVAWMMAIGFPAHPRGVIPTPLPRAASVQQTRRYSVKVDRARTLDADREAVAYTAVGVEVVILASVAVIYLVSNIRRHHGGEIARRERLGNR